jgi:serine phosphatase RsbU (regulator of sigma subunit)
MSVAGQDSILTNIALVDASGIVIDGYPDVDSVDISDREYFHRLRDGADWVVSDLLKSRIDHKPGFVIAVALRQGKVFNGVLLTRIDENRVKQLLAMPESGETILVLADRKGSVAFTNNSINLPYEKRTSENPNLKIDKYRSHKLITQTDLFGQQDLNGAIIPIREIGWTSGAFVPSGRNMLATRIDMIRDALTILVIFIFTVWIGSFIAKQFASSVVDLSDAAEKLGKGHFETRVATPNVTEFATLANTINTMAESIQQRDKDLQLAYQRERRISTAFQESMLPDVPRQIGRMELATAYFPALEEAELGGDFYDVNVLPNGLVGLLVADVSGKGLSAAVHTATAKYALQGFAYEDTDPGRVLTRLSAVLYDNSNTDKFITAFYAVVDPDTGSMVYANAGHPQPILRHKDGSIEWLIIASGPPLGVARHPSYITQDLQLLEGDMLVSYTDGVIEARKGTDWFGMEGLEVILKSGEYSPNDIVCEIQHTVSDFVDGDMPDDIALLAVRMVSDPMDGPYYS